MRVAAIPVLLLAILAAAKSAEAPPVVPLPIARNEASATLAPLIRKVAPGVVNITVLARAAEQPMLPVDPSSGFPDAPYTSTDRKVVGAGVIVDAQRGLIVTNNHVIEGADQISVALADEHQVLAEMVSTDPGTDIAVIRIPAIGLVSLPLGDSDKLQVGDYVIAVGNPFGLGQTVTHGIVSALHRKGMRNAGCQDFIQTDAPINQGNSGGALVNLDGELVGINSESASPTGVNTGIGFAIPVNLVRETLNRMAKGW